MRLSKLLLTATAANLACFAAAQQAEPPAAGEPAAQEEESRPRLGDLDATVDELLREESQPSAEEEAPAASAEEGAPPDEPAPESEAPESEQPGTEGQATTPSEPPADPTAEPVAETPAPPAPPLTRAEIAQVERTAERGRLLVTLARAGILATRDMLSRVSDPESAGIAGWIAEPQGNAVLVTFYAEGADGERPSAVYRANVLGGRTTSREVFLSGDRPPLNPVQARMAAARTASESEERTACSAQPFNVLVVPPTGADDPVDVYRLSTPSQPGRFPLGGHFRASVAPDGTVTESRGFTNACVDVDAPPPAEGEQPGPIGVTHLLDPMPTEVHVFLAQLIGRPLLVATGEPYRVWLVTGERIAEIRPTGADSAQASTPTTGPGPEPLPALDGQIIRAGCRQGECGWLRVVRIERAETHPQGELRRIAVQRGTSLHPDGELTEDPEQAGIEWDESERTEFAFCSRERPAYAFPGGEGEWILHFLDLFDLGGYQLGSGGLYARFCHGRDGLPEEAVLRSLGYAPGTRSEQVETADIAELTRF